MSEQPEELDFEERRKRLEQLFAQEPHLSPTMRARQLYEEPETQSNGNHSNGAAAYAAPDPVAQPLVETVAEAPMPSVQGVARTVAAPEAPRADGMLSIAAARKELRERAGPERAAQIESGDREPDGLDSLRDSVLVWWRRDIYADR